jgi:hypothetical protein
MAPKKLVQVKLRISEDLKRRLDREAKKREDGSLSAEIAERLERSFSSPSLEKAVATTVLNELSDRGWIVRSPPKTGEQS